MIKKFKFSYILIIFLLCFIFLLVGFCLGVIYQRQTQLPLTFPEKMIEEETSPGIKPESSSMEIEAVLPEGALLRDYEKLEGLRDAYLVMYIEKGYEFSSWDYYTCPGAILGDAIAGVYHLALLKEGAFVSDITIPSVYMADSELPLELSFKNIKGNLYQTGEYREEERDEVEVVKLLELNDYTGDGKAYEVLLATTGGGCGFFDGLVAGYDPEANGVALYSGWLPRFRPDSSGNFDFLFDCGDHGNETKVERKYAFDKQEKKFKMTWEQKTPCIYPE